MFVEDLDVLGRIEKVFNVMVKIGFGAVDDFD